MILQLAAAIEERKGVNPKGYFLNKDGRIIIPSDAPG
jgi:hypothetical protein